MAATTRHLWDDAAMDKFDEKMQKLIEREAKKLREKKLLEAAKAT